VCLPVYLPCTIPQSGIRAGQQPVEIWRTNIHPFVYDIKNI